MSDNPSLSNTPSKLSDVSFSPAKSPSKHRILPGAPTSILTQLPSRLEKPATPSSAPKGLSTSNTHIVSSINSNRALEKLPPVPKIGMHIPQPGPPTRQNESWRWPHGVLSGGMLIDILECLSATTQPLDWSMATWLQDHFIMPFGRVERLDGLIVQDPRDMDMLILAHSRYLEIMEEAASVQRLWVPGLEPRWQVSADRDPPRVPPLPRRFERKVWRASEMYYKDGVERKRKGQDMGIRDDEMGWERHLWMAESEVGSETV